MISVIVPIFNMERLLPRCLTSLRRQTYADLEILLVNDGSKDGSLSVCRRAADGDHRIRVLNQRNGGVSSARNAGLDAAHGTWVFFMDPDDYLQSFEIDELLAAAGSDTDVVCGDYMADDNSKMVPVRFFADEFDAQDDTGSYHAPLNTQAAISNIHHAPENIPDDHLQSTDAGSAVISVSQGKRKLYYQLMNSFYGQDRSTFYTAIGVPWAKLYRREFLMRNELRFDEKLSWDEDNVFNMQAFFYAQEVRYRHIDGYCYDYSHSGEMIHAYQPDFQYRVRAAAEARRKFLEDTGLIEDRGIARAYVNEMVNDLAGALKRSVFHRDHHIPFHEKVCEAEKLMRSSAFAFLFEDPHVQTDVNRGKNRLFLRLLRDGRFRMVQLFLER